MNGQSIRNLVESEGSTAVAHKLGGLLAAKKISPTDFSIRELWESFVGPCARTLTYGQRQAGMVFMAEAAVDSTAFSNVFGQVLMSRALDEYQEPGFIGDLLFDVVPSSRRSERLPGFVLLDATDEVNEGMPYPDAGLRDRYVTVESGKKRGLILSITEESVFLDETGSLLRSAANIGSFVRRNRETRMLNVFTGTTASYNPLGVATTFYSSGNGNLIANNALQDWTDIDTAMQTLAAQTDANGVKVLVTPRVIVVPFALASTAGRIVNATQVTWELDPDEPGNRQTAGPNPLVRMLGASPTIITSPLLDDYDDGDEWYIGDPKRAFVYREHWPFQSFRKQRDSEAAFRRDVVEQLKFREWGTAHGVDHRPIQKNAVT